MKNGKIYIFTASILNWKPILFDDRLKQIIINSINFLVKEKGIKLYGFVIMPNHIHLILKPLGNPNYNNIQLSLMRFTAQNIKFHLLDHAPKTLVDFIVNKRDREYQIWQRNPLSVDNIFSSCS